MSRIREEDIILEKLKTNQKSEGEIILNKLFLTLFENKNGLFYKRNYNITNKSTVLGTSIENLLNKNYDYSLFTANIAKTLEFSVNTGNTLIKNILICLNLKSFWNNDENTYVLPEDTIVVCLKKLSEEQESLNDVHYYKNLLINITKHKYVPYIETVNISEIDKQKKELPKIKSSDKLIKFYNFPKNSVCKIINKNNILNNTELYINYRVVI
jgi:DNA-directed RNA polymerase subunit H (RpoH/RPB5)